MVVFALLCIGTRLLLRARTRSQRSRTHTIHIPASTYNTMPNQTRVNYRWLSMVTVHWYKDRSETFNTAQSLLDEPQMRRDAASLEKLVASAGK